MARIVDIKMQDEWVDEKGASAHTSIPVSTLQKLRRPGADGPTYYKLNSRVKYKISDLDKWMAACRIDPSAA